MHESPHDKWLRSLAADDERLLRLLEVSLGRLAAASLRAILAERCGTMKVGDITQSKPLPGEADVVAGWLRTALANDADWLRDVDDDGVPLRLAACKSYDDLIEAADEDFRERPWTLPGR